MAQREQPSTLDDGLSPMADVRWVWDEHPDEDYRRDQSHWRGCGRWDEERWLALGASLRNRLGDLHRSVGRSFRPTNQLSILEWGPGGGANLVAVAPFAAKLYGVEVSVKNLAETRRQLDVVEAPELVPVLVDGSPAAASTSIQEPLDVFFSSAVFHLFPSKQYGTAVLRTAFAVMDVGGLGYIQIRYDNGNPKYAPRRAERYRTDHIYATSWGLSEFWSELENTGLRPIKVANINTKANFAGFYFQK